MAKSQVKGLAIVGSILVAVVIIASKSNSWPVSGSPSIHGDNFDPFKVKLETKVIATASIKSSQNMSQHDHERIQQTQVKQFCNTYHQGELDYTVDLGSQVLIDDRTKTAYCFAPKVGCTHLRVAFLHAQGLLPSDVIETDENLPPQDAFHISPNYWNVLFGHTLMKASIEKRKLVYGTYYKFIMYRNPVERLLSGYRSKIEGYPLLNFNDKVPYKEDIRPQIFKFTQPQKYHRWKASHSKEAINIKFPEFIEHWLFLIRTKQPIERHFQLIYNICKPCQVHYNYYGNFKNFDHDAEVLLKHQGANTTFLRKSYYKESGKTTREIAPEYYRQLSDQQKQLVVDALALDLRFYYNLFPEEEGSHKTIMDTNYDYKL